MINVESIPTTTDETLQIVESSPTDNATNSSECEKSEIKDEVATLREEVATLRIQLKEQEEEAIRRHKELKNENDNYILPSRPLVSKEEAAAILMMSSRQLQRVRGRLKLRWEKVGRETHYLLKDIVDAIWRVQCPWNYNAYERVLERVTRLPKIKL